MRPILHNYWFFSLSKLNNKFIHVLLLLLFFFFFLLFLVQIMYVVWIEESEDSMNEWMKSIKKNPGKLSLFKDDIGSFSWLLKGFRGKKLFFFYILAKRMTFWRRDSQLIFFVISFSEGDAEGKNNWVFCG